MSFEQEKMIVGSLPSLYPLQKFEEEAINTLVSLPIDDDTISRAKAIEALTEYGNGQTLYISVEEATRRIKQLSHAQLGTNLAEVGTDCISREQAIEALDKRFDSIPMEQTSEILMLRKDLRELPPAQPPMPSNTSNALKALDSVNATQFNALDSISRQAAINALERTKRIASNELHSGNVLRLFNDVLNSLIKIMSLLPQTQPEHIIHCKDCKYFKRVFAPNDNDGLCRHWHSKCDARTSREGYCSHAERKQNDTERC